MTFKSKITAGAAGLATCTALAAALFGATAANAAVTGTISVSGGAVQQVVVSGGGDVYATAHDDTSDSGVYWADAGATAATAFPDEFGPDGGNFGDMGPGDNNLALSASGSTLYVDGGETGCFFALDTTTKLHDFLDCGSGAAQGANGPIVVSPSGSAVYAISGLGLSRYTTSGTATGGVSLGGAATGLVITPNGSTLFAVVPSLDEVVVVDAATLSVTGDIPVGGYARSAAVSSDGSTLFVSENGGVAVIDTATDTVTTTFPVAGDLVSIALSPSNDVLYVGNAGTSAVSALDPSSGAVLQTTSLSGNAPNSIAVSADGSKVYVGTSYGNVEVLDGTTNLGQTGPSTPPAPAPAITSLAPSSGVLAGGTTVTIKGENFTPDATVTFAGKPAASETVNSATTITATTPAGTAIGAADVKVVEPAGTAPARFTYVAPTTPKISTPSPKPSNHTVSKPRTVTSGCTADCVVRAETGGHPAASNRWLLPAAALLGLVSAGALWLLRRRSVSQPSETPAS